MAQERCVLIFPVWAAQMHIIGPAPSDTGQPGGQETGDHVSHYIVPGGPFAAAVYDPVLAAAERISTKLGTIPLTVKRLP